MGIRKDGTWSQANSWIGGLGKAALGVAAFFGVKGIGKAMFGFNAMLETSKNQVAEMLAIARKSTLAEQFDEASAAVDKLNDLATKLPGTTEDYINTFKMISGPVLSAKGSMQDLLDITVSTQAFAKLTGRDWATASREIQRGIDGTSRVTDRIDRKSVV